MLAGEGLGDDLMGLAKDAVPPFVLNYSIHSHGLEAGVFGGLESLELILERPQGSSLLYGRFQAWRGRDELHWERGSSGHRLREGLS